MLNRTPFKTNVSSPEYLVVFEGKLKGELHEHEYETDDVGWYPVDKLPPLCKKVTPEEVQRMVDAAVNGETIFD